MSARLFILIFALAASPAHAGNAQTGRYQIVALSDRVMRLDTVTGAMMLCREDGGRFGCTPVIAGVDPLPEKAVPRTDGHADSPSAREPADGQAMEDFDKALTMMEKAMRRFMALTRENPGECEL